jgi:hypothetical protein
MITYLVPKKKSVTVSELWTPLALSDLSLWIDPSDSSTVFLNGSNIAQIDDKSGNARHFAQTNASLRPPLEVAGLNGLNVITFPGANFSLEGAEASRNMFRNTGYGAVFAVIITGTVTSTENILFTSIGTSGNAGRLSLRLMGRRVNPGGRRLDGNSFSSVTGTTVINVTTPAIIGTEFKYNAQLLDSWLNGIKEVSSSVPTWGGPGVTSDTNGQRVRIGQAGGSGEGFRGKLCELVVVNDTDIPALDIDKLNGYFAHKWGINGQLNISHPYKTEPPTI